MATRKKTAKKPSKVKTYKKGTKRPRKGEPGLYGGSLPPGPGGRGGRRRRVYKSRRKTSGKKA